VSKEKFEAMVADKRMWWGKDGNSIPQIKRFLSEVMEGRVPQTIWPYQDVGHTDEAKKELKAVVEFEDSKSVFITPKPRRLLERILQIGTDADSIVLDSFAGSGTTGHAVMALNNLDRGHRRFILIEMDEVVFRKVTTPRLAHATGGYTHRKTVGGDAEIPGLGGGFLYCTLGTQLFDETGNIHAAVKFADLAAHVYFSETGEPMPKGRKGKFPLLGIHNGIGIYLLYNGILGDKTVDGGNVLTGPILQSLPKHDGPRVIYGEGCRLGAARLRREGIVFKQLPYEIKVV
jgi:site-specific DNA-methyltransferase (adenine-specific)/adenine-specific DNA-methyltransferase